MWRREMTDNKYTVDIDYTCEDAPSVNINYCNPRGNYLSAFMVIEIDNEDTPSPFKNIEDAKLFAEIIVKLLDKVGESCDIK